MLHLTNKFPLSVKEESGLVKLIAPPYVLEDEIPKKIHLVQTSAWQLGLSILWSCSLWNQQLSVEYDYPLQDKMHFCSKRVIGELLSLEPF